MPTAAGAMTEVADRLERAIEGRADVEHEIERGEQQAPPRARLARTVFWLAVTGVSLYLVAPSIVEVLGSWSDLDTLAPAWLAGDGGAPSGGAGLPVGAATPRDARPIVARGDRVAARR